MQVGSLQETHKAVRCGVDAVASAGNRSRWTQSQHRDGPLACPCRCGSHQACEFTGVGDREPLLKRVLPQPMVELLNI